MLATLIVDLTLSSVLFLVALIMLYFYNRYDKKVDTLFEGKEFGMKHVILLVAAMGAMVTVLVLIPEFALLLLFLFAYSAISFLFIYLVAPKWYFAVPAPILFLLLYFSPYWNIYLFNIFAIMFSIGIVIYLSNLFTWKTTVGFAFLLTVMDTIQVFITKFTVTSAERALEQKLPIGIIFPIFPSEGWMFLGLGDVFLFGLLSIQTWQKYGKKFGVTSVGLMSRFRASRAVPALPGAQNISLTLGLWASFQASVCSLAPPPTTNILIYLTPFKGSPGNVCS